MSSTPYYAFVMFCWFLAWRNRHNPIFLLPFLRLFVPTTLYLPGLMLCSDYMLFWRPDDRVWFPFRISYFISEPDTEAFAGVYAWVSCPNGLVDYWTGRHSSRLEERCALVGRATDAGS